MKLSNKSSVGYTIANRMTNIWRGSQSASSRYWYDLAANLVTSNVKGVTNCYYYNVQNKLVKINSTGLDAEFRYDSQHRRIAVKQSTMWRYDLHDGNLCIASISNTAMTAFFLRGVGIAEGTGDIIAEVDRVAHVPRFYFNNHRGDTLVALTAGGSVATSLRYDAFGNNYEKTGTFTPRYTFSTKEYLSNAQLYLYAYRVYDPVAGRWTQRDPIDYQDSINLYSFCRNSAINAWDPDGRNPVVAAAGAIALRGLVNATVGAVIGAISGGIAGAFDAPRGLTLSGANAWKGSVAGAAGGAISGVGATLDGVGDVAGGWLGGNVSGRIYASLTGQTGEAAEKTVLFGSYSGIVGGFADAANPLPLFGPMLTGAGGAAANVINKYMTETEEQIKPSTEHIEKEEE